jgi:hypothetical protein
MRRGDGAGVGVGGGWPSSEVSGGGRFQFGAKVLRLAAGRRLYFASQSIVATSSRRFSNAARGAIMSGLSSFASVCQGAIPGWGQRIGLGPERTRRQTSGWTGRASGRTSEGAISASQTIASAVMVHDG